MSEQIRASHILISHTGVDGARTSLTRDDALAQIGALRDRIGGGEDFGEVAREWSDCPSAGRGGDLGYFGKGAMVPEFELAAFALAVDEVSDIVETAFGFHLIRRYA